MNDTILDELISSKIFSIEVNKKLKNLREYVSSLEEFKRTASYKVNTDFSLEHKNRFKFQSGDWAQKRWFMTFSNKYIYNNAIEVLREKYGRSGSFRENFPTWEISDTVNAVSFDELDAAGYVAQTLFGWTKLTIESYSSKEELEAYRDSLPKDSIILHKNSFSQRYESAYFLNKQDAVVFELKFG